MPGEQKIPISVCVIAQNEEDHIGACLQSANFAAELVVLDGGSEDRTMEIAAAAGAEVYERPFDGWVAQKNAAVQRAKYDWIFSLDADERISTELRAEVLALFQNAEPDVCGFDMPRRAFHLGKWIRGGGWYPDRKLRLFCRQHARFAGRDPHDYVQYEGEIRHLNGDLLHYPYSNFQEHVSRMDRYTTAAARAAFEQGRRYALTRMVCTPPLRFLKSFVLRGGFRDGQAGLVLASMAGTYELLRYAKLWNLQREARIEKRKKPEN